jgi:hypothetical protein
MKLLALSFSIIASFSAVAGNPQLDEIMKKYEASLFNFKIGLSYKDNTVGKTLSFNEAGQIVLAPMKTLTEKIILKVEGTKIYTIVKETDLITSESDISVELTETMLDTNDGEYTAISVANNVLTFNYKAEQTDENGSGALITAKITKNLLSPMVCNMKMDSVVTLSSQDLGTFKLPATLTSVCGPIVAREELKKLDLTNIEFCDQTMSDDGEVTCSTQDMSFLINEL